MTLLERLARDLNARGARAFVAPGGLVVNGERFSLREAARIAVAVYGKPRVEVAPRLRRGGLAWEPNDLLALLLDWAEGYRFSPREERLLAAVVSGRIDPVEAQGLAAINGWTEFARALGDLAERWLEVNGA